MGVEKHIKRRRSKGLFTKHLYMLVKLQITIHQQLFTCPNVLKLIIWTASSLQSLSFLMNPNIQRVDDDNMTMNLLSAVTYFCRPDYMLIQLNSTRQWLELGYLIPLTFIIVFDVLLNQILTIYHNRQGASTIGLKNQLSQHNSIIRILIMTSSYYSQLVLVYLWIPLMIIIINSIKINIDLNSYANVLFAVFTLVIFSIFYLLRLLICDESLTLRIMGFEKLQLTKLEIIKEIFFIMQMVVYFAVESNETAVILQSILICIISIDRLAKILINLIIPIRSYCLILIITQSQAGVFAICYIFKQYDIFILLAPLVSYLVIQYWRYQELSLNVSILWDQSIRNIKYYLALVINEQIPMTDEIIQHTVLLFHHRLKCKDILCYCHKETQELHNAKRVIFLTDKLFKQFIHQKLKQFNLLTNRSTTQFDPSHYIHYTSALNIFGWTIQAFQQCSYLTRRTKYSQSKGFVSDSDIVELSRSNMSKHSQSSSQSENKDSNNFKIQSISINLSRKQSKMQIDAQKHNISSYSKQKIQLLQQEIKFQLEQGFSQSLEASCQEVSLAVTQFLESEVSNSTIKMEVMHLLQKKMQFYQLLVSSRDVSSNMLFEKSKNLSQKLLELEIKLTQMYEQFPSQKLQSVNCFFQAEILNNYLKSFKLATFNSISDEKLVGMRKRLKLNLFNSGVTYIIVKLLANMKGLGICKTSNNAHKFFNRSYEQFEKLATIDSLIPNAIQGEHMMLVSRFLNDGQSKFFRNVHSSFVRLPSGLITPFNLFFDLHINNTDEMQFVAFFEEYKSNNVFIMVDVNGIIGGISVSLFELQGFKLSEISRFGETLSEQYNVPIGHVLPNFDELINKTISHKEYNITVKLISKQFIDESHTAEQLSKLKSLNDHSTIWTKDNNIASYVGNIQINVRQIYDFNYYIIEISELKIAGLSEQHSTIIDQTQMRVENSNLADQNSKSMDISNIELSIHEADINQPQTMEPKLVHAADDYQSNQYQMQNPNSVLNREIGLFTPNQSCLVSAKNQSITLNRLMDSSKLSIQQRFFNNDLQQQDSSSAKSGLEAKGQNANQLYEVDMDQIDQEMQDNIKMQLQLDKDQYNNNQKNFIDDIGSQVSSLAGVRKSLFFKKYDILNRIIAHQRMPRIFWIFYIIISLFAFTTSLYFMLVLSQMGSDLTRFLQEIDMLEIHSSFMTPFDKFLAFRLQIQNYNTQLQIGMLSTAQHIELTNWLSSKLQDGYQDMKINFIKQFSNPYLLEFFTDEYFQAYFMEQNSTQLITKNLTFQGSLHTLLSYQYEFKIAYDKNRAITGPFVTYSYANYFKLHERFSELNKNILSYTSYRKQIVEEKWNLVWIPFIVISIACILSALYSYQRYLKTYEQFLDLFKFVDSQWIDRDMERYKILQSILSKDSNVMFKYQFDLELKEKFMLSEKYKKDSQKGRKDDKKQRWNKQNKLSLVNIILVVCFSIALYISSSMFIQLQTTSYLQKYQKTASIYKLTSDVTFRIPGVYGQRNFAFFLNAFTYFNSTDREKLTTWIQNGFTDMREFNFKIMELDESYLITNRLISLISEVVQNPICDILTAEQLTGAEVYCHLAFEGSLDNGLGQSFNFIINSLNSEYQLNNFTINIDRKLYEAEGAFILVKAMQIIQAGMKIAMIDATESRVAESAGIAISYIVVTIVLMVLLYTYILQYYRFEYQTVKRYLLLLPSSTLMLDDLFERSLRILQVKEGN